MKIIKIAAICLLTIAASSSSLFAQTRYKDYFVVNTFKMDEQHRFQVFTDMKSLDAIFHAGAVMGGKQKWATPADFNNNIFIAAMQENAPLTQPGIYTKFALSLKKIKVKSDGEVLFEYANGPVGTVQYKGGAYLMYKVNKANVKKVTFVENGKKVKTITL
jgi:hypothetical protein